MKKRELIVKLAELNNDNHELRRRLNDNGLLTRDEVSKFTINECCRNVSKNLGDALFSGPPLMDGLRDLFERCKTPQTEEELQAERDKLWTVEKAQ